jgi:hypothetical protein
MELVWAGTIATSTITFDSILQFWLNGNRPKQCDNGDDKIPLNFQWNEHSMNIMYKFWRTARYLRLKVLRGP